MDGSGVLAGVPLTRVAIGEEHACVADAAGVAYSWGDNDRDRYKIDIDGQSDLSALGNIVDHEYKIEQDGDTVATVSKSWFRVRDTYGVEIAPDQDEALILAVTVCMDSMARG
jgi:uncharacterized protein YxjI